MVTNTLYEDTARPLANDQLVSYDRELTVLCILSQGIKPVKIYSEDGRKITFQFEKTEANVITSKMLSNEAIAVEFGNVLKAMELWNNAIVKMKAERTSTYA